MFRSCLAALFLSFLLACHVPQSSVSTQAVAIVQSHFQASTTITGQVERLEQVSSAFLGNKRDVLVWLPPDYARSQRTYPVLYMHDGNNIFDRSTSFGGAEWEVDERATDLIQKGIIEPVIIVGINNTPARLDEYTWQSMNLDGVMRGGNGANYARFLVEELKPLIDKKYRTRPGREDTAVMGSSLGGLISFYLGKHYPNVFSKIGMMSPSIWWKDQQAIADISGLSTDLKIWVDMGTQEGQNPDAMLQTAKDFVSGLEQQGYQHFHNLAFHIEPGGTHSEQSWAGRIERPLRFFYEASSSSQ